MINQLLMPQRFAKEEALAEIYRVLKPGGKLAMIWNVEDCKRIFPVPSHAQAFVAHHLGADNKPAAWQAANKWGQALHELILSLPTGGQPRFRDDVWRQVFNGQTLFSTPLDEEKTPWTVWLELEALWDRVNTLSQVAILEGEERTSFRKRFDDIVKGGDAEWNGKHEVGVHGVTFYTWTSKV